MDKLLHITILCSHYGGINRIVILNWNQTNLVIVTSTRLECRAVALHRQPWWLKTRGSVSINNNQCPYINSVPKVSIPVTFTLAWDQFCSLRYPLCYVMGTSGGPSRVVVLACTWVPSSPPSTLVNWTLQLSRMMVRVNWAQLDTNSLVVWNSASVPGNNY